MSSEWDGSVGGEGMLAADYVNRGIREIVALDTGLSWIAPLFSSIDRGTVSDLTKNDNSIGADIIHWKRFRKLAACRVLPMAS